LPSSAASGPIMAMPTASTPELEQPPASFFQHPILGPLTLQQGKLSSSTEQGRPSTVVEQNDSLPTSMMDSLNAMAGAGWAEEGWMGSAAPEEVCEGCGFMMASDARFCMKCGHKKVPQVSDVDATPTPSELSTQRSSSLLLRQNNTQRHSRNNRRLTQVQRQMRRRKHSS